MKRFLITNIRNGMLFEVRAEGLPARQPEWGKPAGIKLYTLCDDWERTHGSDAGTDDEFRVLWSFPDSMQVQEFDLTAELAAEEAENEERRLAKEKIKALKKSDLDTVAKCADAILDLAKLLKKLV